MTTRGPVLVTALVALAAAGLLWLAFGVGNEGGTEVSPQGKEPRAAEKLEADLVIPQPSAVAQETEAVSVVEQREESRSVVPPVWSAPLRGRVLDRFTEDGAPKIMVHIKSGARTDRVRTDDDGWFESPVSYERSRLALTAFDLLGRGFSRGVSRGWSHYEEAGELVWRIDVGPTFRPSRIGGPEGAEWKARLREVNADGEERAWSWIDVDVSEGWPAWIRYPKVEHASDQDWTPALQLADADERWVGETHVPATTGQHPEPIRVVVEARAAAIQGTVTDIDGEPVDAHVLLLLRGRDGDRSWLETGTEGEGEYALEEVPGGVHRLMIRTDHRPVARFDVVAVPGEVTTKDVVLPSVTLAGDVTGALVGPAGGGDPFAAVQLEALDGGSTNLAQTVGFNLFSDPDGADRTEFAFEGLPAGRYRVSVIPIDGRHYERTEVIVGVPTEGLLFVTDDREGEDEVEHVLTVRDAPSGEVLPEISVLWRFGPFWSAEVFVEPGELTERGAPPSLDFHGVLCAPGHLPAEFSFADFERAGDTMRLDVALERGHGGALVILDAERMLGGAEARLEEFMAAEGLDGARVVAGGRVIGTSDARGLALLDAPEAVESFDVRAPGWAVFARIRFQNHAETPDGIGFVLMARE